MLFNSFAYLIFFPLVVTLYFLIQPKYRWALLLISSYYFYAVWKYEYLILIVGSTLVDYYCGLFIGQSNNPSKRKYLLGLSLLINLGVLFTFKYLGFFYETFELLTAGSTQNTNYFKAIVLPMGISFYTFQSLSYTIDVYKGELEPETHLGKFALYVSFFPQLVAGPIERAKHLLPQMSKVFKFSEHNLKTGLRLILWGLLKKVVIADRLALYVNPVYENPDWFQGTTLLIATLFFAFQIYCDFSGYSDIAIGSARVMGFDLMKNFRAPYLSTSFSNFWKRWHISLSTWFKDYVYIPLGGNRTIKWRWYYNLLITFLVSGFWHGANWTFIIWGGLHGMYLILEQEFQKIKVLQTLPLLLKGAIIFVLTCFAWVFFRAENLGDATQICIAFFDFQFDDLRDLLWMGKQLLSGDLSILESKIYFTKDNIGINMYFKDFIVSWFSILTLFMADYLIIYKNYLAQIDQMSRIGRWSIYYLLIFVLLYFGIFTSNEFIYFQF